MTTTVNKPCHFCGQTMAVEKRYSAAMVSHLNCAMEATREARETLQRRNSILNKHLR